MLRRFDARETLPNEEAQTLVNRSASAAFGAGAKVSFDFGLFGVSESAVEEKVDYAFDIVTEHVLLPSLVDE